MQDSLLQPSVHSPLRRRLALGLPLAGACWLLPPMASAATVSQQRSLMGTLVDLRVHHPNAATAQRAAEAAWQEMQRLEAMMSRYVPGNPLAAIQTAAGIEPVTVPRELFATLQAAHQVSRASRGAFDVTVGSLQGWDFRPGHYQAASPESVARQLSLVNQQAGLVLDAQRQTAFLRRQGMRLDLGGIAKLPILSSGMQVLQDHGIQSAMLNGGGDILVRGGNLGAPWRIGVRDPRDPRQLLGTVALKDGVVAASGDYERCFEHAGARMHHILDPHTGYPSNGPRGVVLVARTTDAVNGWGAATMVAGLQFGREQIAHQAGIEGLIVEANHSVWMSPGMGQLLQQG
ncbi:MAG: FAD:protein FMN transferase [Rhodoferax sp.]|nr:MAG: FAD:protein FMN transferase [Rhodoferax sp.]